MIIFKKKPRKCPKCDSKTVARILYGMPAFSPELEKDLEYGKIVLGGCVINPDDPTWSCVKCGTNMYRERRAQEYFTST